MCLHGNDGQTCLASFDQNNQHPFFNVMPDDLFNKCLPRVNNRDSGDSASNPYSPCWPILSLFYRVVLFLERLFCCFFSVAILSTLFSASVVHEESLDYHRLRLFAACGSLLPPAPGMGGEKAKDRAKTPLVPCYIRC